jgi:hypothetical protein
LENIFEAQKVIKEFFEKEVLKEYSFSDWKNTLVNCTNNDIQALSKQWNVIGSDVNLTSVIVDVEASNDEWDACAILEYEWEINKTNVGFRITLVKNEVRSLQITDMLNITKKIGTKFSLAEEFNKVVLIYKLKNV